MRLEHCRSCRAPIVWARTVPTGRAMPVDWTPVDGGNVILTETGLTVHATVTTSGAATGWHAYSDVGELFTELELTDEDMAGAQEATDDHILTYTSHFATCPDAQKWRRRDT